MFSRRSIVAFSLACGLLAFSSASFGQQAGEKPAPGKVWTNDDLGPPPPETPASAQESTAPGGAGKPAKSPGPYKQAEDPAWYGKQIRALREELGKIDADLSVVAKGQNSASFDLSRKNEGVTNEAQTQLLRDRRSEILRQIAQLEDDARRNGIEPGALRAAETPEEPTERGREEDSARAAAEEADPDIVATRASLQAEKDNLERLKREADLSQRQLDLDRPLVYSNPNYLSSKAGQPRLDADQQEITNTQQEMQRSTEKIAELEEKLENLIRSLPSPGEPRDLHRAASGRKQAAPETDEAYWRKRFADQRYQIHMTEWELDILQRELGVLNIQYEPNPTHVLIESVTREEINKHRQAIAEKQDELQKQRQALADLEDELRHAGGPPGWARE